jgi:hypothetical protein
LRVNGPDTRTSGLAVTVRTRRGLTALLPLRQVATARNTYLTGRLLLNRTAYRPRASTRSDLNAVHLPPANRCTATLAGPGAGGLTKPRR